MKGVETTILVLIDALGFEIADRHRFRPAGLMNRARLSTVLGFSQAALTSIMTGLTPDEHGLWMMYAFSRNGSPFAFLDLVPEAFGLDRLWLRRLVDWKLRRVDRVRSYYSLYRVPRGVIRYLDLPARDDLFAMGGAGDRRTIIDDLAGRGEAVFVRDYRTAEGEAFDALEAAVRRDEARFYVLYTAGLDGDLHRHGTAGASIGERLRWYGERIAAIRSLAPQARIVVMGDHGMCDVASTIDVASRVDSLDLRIPDDYIPFYDSTMARFRLFTPRARTRLSELVGSLTGGRILDHDELDRLGVRFPDGRFGDLIFLADPGVIVLPSFMSADPVRGMHGYHPDAPAMQSVLFTNAPDVGEQMSICDVAKWLVPGMRGAAGGERR